MKLTKEQLVTYGEILRVGRDEGVGIALIALLEHDLDRVKELIISTHIGEVAVLQGEAQAYKKYLKALKEPRRASTSEV